MQHEAWPMRLTTSLIWQQAVDTDTATTTALAKHVEPVRPEHVASDDTVTDPCDTFTDQLSPWGIKT